MKKVESLKSKVEGQKSIIYKKIFFLLSLIFPGWRWWIITPTWFSVSWRFPLISSILSEAWRRFTAHTAHFSFINTENFMH